MIRRLNHAVLFVRDTETSVGFYRDVLGFVVVNSFGTDAAFLRAADSPNDHDLGLFGIGGHEAAAGRSIGLYHLAWEVDTLAALVEMRGRLQEAGALVGASDHGASKSLYGRDPDGIEFEVMWEVPADLLEPRDGMKVAPLDLDAELERFGATTSRNI